MSCTSTRVEVASPPMRVGVLLVLAGLVAASCTGGRATPPGPTTAGPTTTTPPAPGAAAPSTAGPPAPASDSTGAASAKAAPAAATAATTGTVDVGAGLADLRLIGTWYHHGFQVVR